LAVCSKEQLAVNNCPERRLGSGCASGPRQNPCGRWRNGASGFLTDFAQTREEEASLKIENAFRVPTGGAISREVLGKSGVESIRARNILQLLLRDKRLIRVSDELVFHGSAIQSCANS